LDEHWVGDALRYKLIRALIETVRSFQKVRYVKIIVALRLDLLGRVITATRDSGFQEEKYDALYLKLRWSRQQIEELLDRRIGKLVSGRYTTRAIKLKELFPRQIGKTTFLDYLVERTFYRPRDAILFINSCLDHAEQRANITSQIVSAAEGEYSGKRLTSLQEEWGAVYPNLSRYANILRHQPSTFKLGSIPRDAMEQIFYDDFSRDIDGGDPVFQAASEFFLAGKGTLHGFLIVAFNVFYIVGLVGLKPDTTTGTFWSFHSTEVPSSGSLKPGSIAYVHPTFWRTLGIKFHE
jgi:hypothetical protein